jgi:hypothetical protein
MGRVDEHIAEFQQQTKQGRATNLGRRYRTGLDWIECPG